MHILVDTSVWVDHFRKPNTRLMNLLTADRVIIHPFIIAEIACGTPPDRKQTLTDLDRLRKTGQVTMSEFLAFVEQHQLYGKGCGYVDLCLLASTLLTGNAKIWTKDKSLIKLSADFHLLWKEI